VKKNEPALEKVLTIIKDLKGVYIVKEKGWRRSERACLSAMWPGLDFGPVPCVA